MSASHSTLHEDAHVAHHDSHDEHDHHDQSFLEKYIFSQDHKVIAKQFLNNRYFLGIIR
jgi:cytochrome c oxidase subunit I